MMSSCSMSFTVLVRTWSPKDGRILGSYGVQRNRCNTTPWPEMRGKIPNLPCRGARFRSHPTLRSLGLAGWVGSLSNRASETQPKPNRVPNQVVPAQHVSTSVSEGTAPFRGRGRSIADQDARGSRTLRVPSAPSAGSSYSTSVSEPGRTRVAPLNVLIGPNDSVKSNLIEALALMRSTPENVHGEVRRSGGSWSESGRGRVRIPRASPQSIPWRLAKCLGNPRPRLFAATARAGSLEAERADCTSGLLRGSIGFHDLS